MKIINNVAEIQPYDSKIYQEYFGDLAICVIDIETTGLHPNFAKVILGGLLTPEHKQAKVVQYFADERNDEAALLKEYGNALASSDVLITYNGHRFDLPFLKHRFRRHGLDLDLDTVQSFDLYRALHYYSKMREILPDLKQKSIEAFLGLSPLREDEISGGESVDLYNEYMRSRSTSALEKVLLHNRDDLVQLASIIRVLDKLDLHKILFYEGFTIASPDKKIHIKEISLGSGSLVVTAKTRNVDLDYYSFETGYQAIHKAKERELTLSVPYEKRHGASFIDLESIGADFTPLEKYPSYESGFLILEEKGIINYAEINKAVKIILGEILKTSMI